MAKDKDQRIVDPETADQLASLGSADSRESTAARMNREKLGQEESFSVDPVAANGSNEYSKLMDTDEAIDAGKDLNEAGTGDPDDEDVEIVMGTEADVTEEDLILLGNPDQDMDGGDDEMVAVQGLDDTDEDGDPLNEASSDMSTTGDDLDIPDADMDDPDKEALGQGDEENNYYSLGSDKNDNVTEGTP